MLARSTRFLTNTMKLDWKNLIYFNEVRNLLIELLQQRSPVRSPFFIFFFFSHPFFFQSFFISLPPSYQTSKEIWTWLPFLIPFYLISFLSFFFFFFSHYFIIIIIFQKTHQLSLSSIGSSASRHQWATIGRQPFPLFFDSLIPSLSHHTHFPLLLLLFVFLDLILIVIVVCKIWIIKLIWYLSFVN